MDLFWDQETSHALVIGVATNGKGTGVRTLAVNWPTIRDDVHSYTLACIFQKISVQPEVGGVELADEDVPSVLGYCHGVKKADDLMLHLRHYDTPVSETPGEDIQIIKKKSLYF